MIQTVDPIGRIITETFGSCQLTNKSFLISIRIVYHVFVEVSSQMKNLIFPCNVVVFGAIYLLGILLLQGIHLLSCLNYETESKEQDDQ